MEALGYGGLHTREQLGPYAKKPVRQTRVYSGLQTREKTALQYIYTYGLYSYGLYSYGGLQTRELREDSLAGRL